LRRCARASPARVGSITVGARFHRGDEDENRRGRRSCSSPKASQCQTLFLVSNNTDKNQEQSLTPPNLDLVGTHLQRMPDDGTADLDDGMTPAVEDSRESAGRTSRNDPGVVDPRSRSFRSRSWERNGYRVRSVDHEKYRGDRARTDASSLRQAKGRVLRSVSPGQVQATLKRVAGAGRRQDCWVCTMVGSPITRLVPSLFFSYFLFLSVLRSFGVNLGRGISERQNKTLLVGALSGRSSLTPQLRES